MQIDRIAIYSLTGEIRTIQFRLGAVNVITGKSRTGKSALIDIVDYCMGRSTYKIFEGVNRSTVAYYAVVFHVGEGQVLIAKPPPEIGGKSQRRAYVKTAASIELPALRDLEPNTNDDGVTQYLSRVLGISENRTEPAPGRTTPAFEASVDHAKFYLFQEQGVIANRKLLFHRQDEEFVPQHIRDTFPYFIGAVQEERLQLIQQAREAKRRLTLLRRRIAESEAVVGNNETLARALVVEAQQAGLVSTAAASTANSLLESLQMAAAWSPGQGLAPENSRIPQLQSMLREAEGLVAEQLRLVRDAELYAQGANRYTAEAESHEHRLRAIELVNDSQLESHCPLCNSELPNPSASVSSIRRALSSIRDQLEGVRREEPRLTEHLVNLREELSRRRQVMNSVRAELTTAVREEDSARGIGDERTRAARVAGRISMYVESISDTQSDAPLRRQERELADLVEELSTRLAQDEVDERTQSALRVISNYMTRGAEQLKMEFSGSPYRFDERRLTVIADSMDQPIPMDRQGSAENWLGCHLILMLALHEHFIRRDRPVPGFLILDQPTQVYFPTLDAYRALEGDENISEVGADVVAVNRMFAFLFDATERLSPNLQIIVTEHANLPNERFQAALVEAPWRGNLALIPMDWLQESNRL